MIPTRRMTPLMSLDAIAVCIAEYEDRALAGDLVARRPALNAAAPRRVINDNNSGWLDSAVPCSLPVRGRSAAGKN